MSATHYTYKGTGRYAFGWSDPRLNLIGLGDMKEEIDHFSKDMTTEQLRAAWLLEYGDREVPMEALHENKDMYNIGKRLYIRGQLYEGKSLHYVSMCYRLKSNQDANS